VFPLRRIVVVSGLRVAETGMRVESDWFAHDDNAAAQSSPNNRVLGCVFMGTAPVDI
jgi:hypothetical protein